MRDTKAKKELIRKYINLTQLPEETPENYYRELSTYGNPFILGDNIRDDTFLKFIEIAIKEIRKNDDAVKVGELGIFKQHGHFLYEKKYSKKEISLIRAFFNLHLDAIELLPYLEKSERQKGLLSDFNLGSFKIFKKDIYYREFLSKYPKFLFFIKNVTEKDIETAVKAAYDPTIEMNLFDFLDICLNIVYGETTIAISSTLSTTNKVLINWTQVQRSFLLENLKKYFSKTYILQKLSYVSLPFIQGDSNFLIDFLLDIYPEVLNSMDQRSVLLFLRYSIESNKDISQYSLTTDLINSLPIKHKVKIYPKIKNDLSLDLVKIYGGYTPYTRPGEKNLFKIQKEIQKTIFPKLFKYDNSLKGQKQLLKTVSDLFSLNFKFTPKLIEKLLSMYSENIRHEILLYTL